MKCFPAIYGEMCVWWHCCCSILVFSVVLNAIPIPFIPFQQMSEECYDKTFILNIIDSSHLPWKGLVHWSARWDRCLISVYSVFLKWAAPCDHLRKLSALAREGEEWWWERQRGRGGVTGHLTVHVITRETHHSCNETDMLINATAYQCVSGVEIVVL